ncbi:MAG: PAS domain-containing protein [Chloroflexi bacterium]|nr:PAS domain-containing protein [Chloroflexota bacterium]
MATEGGRGRHSLLRRQLRRHLGELGESSPELQAFLRAVDEAYYQFDADRALLERSMDLASEELFERNRQLEREVDERRKAEAERAQLSEQIERERGTLAAVMAGMVDGLIVLDSDGLVRYCNQQAGALVGADPGQLCGGNLGTLLDALAASASPQHVDLGGWRRALTTPEHRQAFEVRLLRPTPHDLLVQVFPVTDDSGAGLGTGLLLHDVTAARELERTKDELISVVSHELRTPLASLVGFAELLLNKPLSPAQTQRYLGIMVDEGRRLTALLNDFLDLQRIQSGRQPVHTLPVDPIALLDRALLAVADDPERPILLDVPAELPPVRADPDRLQQVLANLISNARKYSPGGGEVWIRARTGDGEEAGFVTITVVDQGLGIPPEAPPHLFEQFYRVDNSDRRAIVGTGLGLAICRKIVEAHGGRIWVESPGLGEGASFSFTLPISAEGWSVVDALIVDGDGGFARLLAAELLAEGLSAIRVANPELALEQLELRRPKVLIVDALLAQRPALSFLGRPREPGAPTPLVIAITTHELSPSERQALEALGVVDLLPRSPAAIATIARLVRGLTRTNGD